VSALQNFDLLCFFVVLWFEHRAFTLSNSTSPFFLWWFFWDRVLQTICPGWLQTSIPLTSASWVAGITDVSHQCPARYNFFNTRAILHSREPPL
jgi:hypothetical protein